MNERRKILYEGKAKILFEGSRDDTLIQYFKDDMTAFNKERHRVMEGKGVINNRISSHLMDHMGCLGIRTHLLEQLNMREQLVKKLDMFPLEIVVRNLAAGSLCRRIDRFQEGDTLPNPLVEFYYKKDALGDPLINTDHIIALDIMDEDALDDIRATALRINDILSSIMLSIHITLVDVKLEFGRTGDSEDITLGDEISPDSCRLWDRKTKTKMDKDRFRQNLGHVIEHYREVALRLGVLPPHDAAQTPKETDRKENTLQNITQFRQRTEKKT
ncbi:MAG: phosphoribosylaminoimidazolesuccinocarboxamide synthase [Alphaproteobacteria bacterium GM7ARS4]|nr:phosphoribosylaminoimidazolesuccinocarboxamide synthase [Alphaproteobacteria bacterium GM7ARS4]